MRHFSIKDRKHYYERYKYLKAEYNLSIKAIAERLELSYSNLQSIIKQYKEKDENEKICSD